MTDATCFRCDQPATTMVRVGIDGYRVPSCALHKAVMERKNLYLPCIISADLDSMTPEEQAATLKRTYWSDNITNAEWPAVLKHEGVKAYVKSKLKKKAVGWLMALSRIIYLHPTLGATILREADALYREQIQEPPPLPWAVLADLIEQGWSGEGMGKWLRPLGNLKSFKPEQLATMTQYMVAEYEGWELQTSSNDEEKAA